MKLRTTIVCQILASALVCGLFTAIAPAAPIFINFTATTSSSAGWNRLNIATNGGSGVTLANLIDNTNAATAIDVAITVPFAGQNTNGTSSPTGDAAEFAGATNDSGYGNGAGTFSGHTVRSSQVTFTDLNPGSIYNFTFVASRSGVSPTTENRETKYELVGLSTNTTYLNAANNTSQVATLTGIQPDANGTIVLNLSAGPNNTNSYKFFYLGAMKIEAVPEPASLGLLAIGGLALVRRRR